MIDDLLTRDRLSLDDGLPDAPGEELPADFLHGVHYTGCQDDRRPVITTWCGLAVEHSGRHATPTGDTPRTSCPDCDKAQACPACGARFVYTVSDVMAETADIGRRGAPYRGLDPDDMERLNALASAAATRAPIPFAEAYSLLEHGSLPAAAERAYRDFVTYYGAGEDA